MTGPLRHDLILVMEPCTDVPAAMTEAFRRFVGIWSNAWGNLDYIVPPEADFLVWKSDARYFAMEQYGRLSPQIQAQCDQLRAYFKEHPEEVLLVAIPRRDNDEHGRIKW